MQAKDAIEYVKSQNAEIQYMFRTAIIGAGTSQFKSSILKSVLKSAIMQFPESGEQLIKPSIEQMLQEHTPEEFVSKCVTASMTWKPSIRERIFFFFLKDQICSWVSDLLGVNKAYYKAQMSTKTNTYYDTEMALYSAAVYYTLVDEDELISDAFFQAATGIHESPVVIPSRNKRKILL